MRLEALFEEGRTSHSFDVVNLQEYGCELMATPIGATICGRWMRAVRPVVLREFSMLIMT